MNIVIRKSSDPFSRVPNAVLEDCKISWKAKGILAYLLGRPPGWKAMVADLENKSPDGEHSIRSGILELRAIGYAHLEGVKIKGKFKEWRLAVFDKPRKPDCDFPLVDFPDVENQHHNKKDSNKNEYIYKQAEEIYLAYPRHVAKPAAIKAIARQLKTHPFAYLLSRTHLYNASKPIDEKFIPYPATWFNQERFNDKIIESSCL